MCILGKVIICAGRYGENPYYMGQVGINLYSIEELCYYLKEHAYLLDKEIMNFKLVEWIQEELGLEELGISLRSLIRNESTLSAYVATILETTFYCDKNEIHHLKQIICENSTLDIYEKRKKKADYFTKNKKYSVAISEYEKLLEDIGKQDYALTTSVYHNIGVCLTKLFLFQRAAYWFYKAYEMNGRKDCLLLYMSAMKLAFDPAEYREKILSKLEAKELEAELNSKLEGIAAQWNQTKEKLWIDEFVSEKDSAKSQEYYKKVEELITQWKNEFRDSSIK